MKILQISPYFLPHNGGIERYVYNLSSSLVKKGHDVEVLTSNIPPTQKEEEIEGIRVRRFKSLGTPLRNPIVPGLFREVKKNIRDYDLIHAHMLYSTAAACGVYMKQITRLPLVLTHHGRMRFEEPWKDVAVSVYERILIREILRRTDKVVVLSDSDAEFLGSYDNIQKIHVIPNAINPLLFISQFDSDIERYLKENEIFNKNIIFFAGRLIESKGLDYLIEAVKKVKCYLENFNALVVIAGKGPYYQNLNHQCQKYQLSHLIRFIGDLPFSGIIRIYQRSKIFILPSISEGFPTTVLEAMYFGVPVIATNIPVMEQYFSDLAILVPPRDSERLAEAILYLMKNPDICQKLSIKGKEKVMSEYTWDNIVQQYLKLFDDLQSKKQQGRK